MKPIHLPALDAQTLKPFASQISVPSGRARRRSHWLSSRTAWTADTGTIAVPSRNTNTNTHPTAHAYATLLAVTT